MIKEVEAVLFLAPKPLKIEEISNILGASAQEISRAIDELKEKYKDSALVVKEYYGAFRLEVREEYNWIAKKLGLIPEFNKRELKVVAKIMKAGKIRLSDLKKASRLAEEVVDKLRRFGFVVIRKKGRSLYVVKTKVMDTYFRLEKTGKDITREDG